MTSKTTRRILALALGAIVLPGAAQAESFGGQARAISGDTLVVGGREVHLFGIEAAEASKDAAQQRLAALVVGRQVQCIATATDAKGRPTAVCAAGLTDLNRTMTELGLATAQKGTGDIYLAVQERAKSRGLGLWAAKITPASFALSEVLN